MEVDVPLLEEPLAGGRLKALDWFIGSWNSLQEGGPGLGQTRTGDLPFEDNWYESDLYTGLRARLSGGLSTSLRFNHYLSPSGSFGGIQELDWRISYNDAPFWENRFGWNFGLFPSLRVAHEIDDKGGRRQWYVQPSLAPTLTLSEPISLTLTFPLAAGFGGDGQYVATDGEDHRFGFLQAGVTFKTPVGFLSAAEDWNLSGGVNVVFLADRDLSFRGNRFETVFHLGLSAGF